MRFQQLSQYLSFVLGLLLFPLALQAQDQGIEDALPSVNVEDAKDFKIEPIAETGYFNERNRYVVDLLEKDYAYIAVRVETAEGQPVKGAVPTLTIAGDSQLKKPEELARNPATDEFGVVEFAVVGGRKGLNTVSVRLGKASTNILVNVISLRAAGVPAPAEIKGGISWENLMNANVQYTETGLAAEFPDVVQKRAGETVKLSGFMMPLEPELKQSRFLLTSNPPGCFFHLPGGPAGAVEVFVKEGLEVSWEPVVLEGRFEPLSSSEVGVVYQLHDARLVTP